MYTQQDSFRFFSLLHSRGAIYPIRLCTLTPEASALRSSAAAERVGPAALAPGRTPPGPTRRLKILAKNQNLQSCNGDSSFNR
jgi:hypothetical protein